MVWCGLVGFDLVSYGLFQIRFSMVWSGLISYGLVWVGWF